jgi:RhtB (resistance to homoserine/threonine) family protein
MALFLHLVFWFFIQLAATISPGPAFAMTVRTAMTHGRRSGIALATGLGLGVGTVMLLVACGLALLIQQSALLFAILKYAGAAYLAWIGIKALRAKKKSPAGADASATALPDRLGDIHAVRRGYLTNILNPKGIVFMTAVFTQFIAHNTAPALIGAYCVISIFVETSWFTLVALILTHPQVKNRFLAASHWIERICGALLLGLALRLVFFTQR